MGEIVLTNNLSLTKEDFERLNGTQTMERLIKYKYTVRTKSSPHNKIRYHNAEYNQLVEWCKNNCTELYHIQINSQYEMESIYFSSEKDAMMFKLHM